MCILDIWLGLTNSNSDPPNCHGSECTEVNWYWETSGKTFTEYKRNLFVGDMATDQRKQCLVYKTESKFVTDAKCGILGVRQTFVCQKPCD